VEASTVKAQELLESKAWTPAVIVGHNSGGLLAKIVDCGPVECGPLQLRGFVPYSQMGSGLRLRISNIEMELKAKLDPEESMAMTEALQAAEAKKGDGEAEGPSAAHAELRAKLRHSALTQLTGEEVLVHVIDVVKETGRVIMSSDEDALRATTDPTAILEAKKAKLKIVSSISEGEEVDCTITNLADFAAFCQVHGVDAMIHISEISYKHIKHPSDALSVGQHVRAQVLSIDQKQARITLSLKALQRDPLLETLEDLVDKAEAGDAELEEGNLTEVETVCQLLLMKDSVSAAVAGKRFRSPAVSQDFQLWLSAQTEDGFKLVARKEFSMQEVEVTTSLTREDLRAAVENIVRVMSSD